MHFHANIRTTNKSKQIIIFSKFLNIFLHSKLNPISYVIKQDISIILSFLKAKNDYIRVCKNKSEGNRPCKVY